MNTVFLESIINEIQPQYLLHCAWCLSSLFAKENYDFLASGIHLIQRFIQNGGKRIVCVGSQSEYGQRDHRLAESDIVDHFPSDYGFCKHSLYRIAHRLCSSSNVSFGWGRVFTAYGKDFHGRNEIGALWEKFLRKEAIILSNGFIQRDFIYVKDAAMALVHLLQSDVTGAVNICTGQATSVRHLITQFARKIGRENLLQFNDRPCNKFPITVGDPTRLIQEVKFTPRYTMEQGLEEIAQAFLREANGSL